MNYGQARNACGWESLLFEQAKNDQKAARNYLRNSTGFAYNLEREAYDKYVAASKAFYDCMQKHMKRETPTLP